MKTKCIPVSSDLANVEKLTKINPNPSTLDEREENIIELESLYKSLATAKKTRNKGKYAWQTILKDLEGASSFD